MYSTQSSFSSPNHSQPYHHSNSHLQIPCHSHPNSISQPLCDIGQYEYEYGSPFQTVKSPPWPGQIYTMAEPRVSISAYCVSNPEEAEDDGEEEDNKEREHHKKRSKDWTMAQTLKVIKLRTEIEPRFAERAKKLEIWNEIAETLSTDAQQCREKWENLVASYKGVKDDNSFFQQIHPLMARKGKYRDCEDYYNPFFEAARVCSETAERGYEADHNDVEMINYDDYYRGKEEWEAHKGEKCRLKPDLSAVNEIVGEVSEKHEEFLRDVLKNVERREEMRELARQRREEKWKAQSEGFENALLPLSQGFVGNFEPGALTNTPAIPFNGNNQVLKKRSKNWNRGEVVELIKLRGEMHREFAESRRRGLLWNRVAECLMAQGINRDAKQCREKWDKLVAEYKRVVDDKKDACLSPFFADLEAILGRDLVHSE